MHQNTKEPYKTLNALSWLVWQIGLKLVAFFSCQTVYLNTRYSKKLRLNDLFQCVALAYTFFTPFSSLHLENNHMISFLEGMWVCICVKRKPISGTFRITIRNLIRLSSAMAINTFIAIILLGSGTFSIHSSPFHSSLRSALMVSSTHYVADRLYRWFCWQLFFK